MSFMNDESISDLLFQFGSNGQINSNVQMNSSFQTNSNISHILNATNKSIISYQTRSNVRIIPDIFHAIKIAEDGDLLINLLNKNLSDDDKMNAYYSVEDNTRVSSESEASVLSPLYNSKSDDQVPDSETAIPLRRSNRQFIIQTNKMKEKIKEDTIEQNEVAEFLLEYANYFKETNEVAQPNLSNNSEFQNSQLVDDSFSSIAISKHKDARKNLNDTLIRIQRADKGHSGRDAYTLGRDLMQCVKLHGIENENTRCYLCGYPLVDYKNPVNINGHDYGKFMKPNKQHNIDYGNPHIYKKLHGQRSPEHVLPAAIGYGLIGLWSPCIKGKTNVENFLRKEMKWSHYWCNEVKNDVLFITWKNDNESLPVPNHTNIRWMVDALWNGLTDKSRYYDASNCWVFEPFQKKRYQNLVHYFVKNDTTLSATQPQKLWKTRQTKAITDIIDDICKDLNKIAIAASIKDYNSLTKTSNEYVENLPQKYLMAMYSLRLSNPHDSNLPSWPPENIKISDSVVNSTGNDGSGGAGVGSIGVATDAGGGGGSAGSSRRIEKSFQGRTKEKISRTRNLQKREAFRIKRKRNFRKTRKRITRNRKTQKQ